MFSIVVGILVKTHIPHFGIPKLNTLSDSWLHRPASANPGKQWWWFTWLGSWHPCGKPGLSSQLLVWAPVVTGNGRVTQQMGAALFSLSSRSSDTGFSFMQTFSMAALPMYQRKGICLLIILEKVLGLRFSGWSQFLNYPWAQYHQLPTLIFKFPQIREPVLLKPQRTSPHRLPGPPSHHLLKGLAGCREGLSQHQVLDISTVTQHFFLPFLSPAFTIRS